MKMVRFCACLVLLGGCQMRIQEQERFESLENRVQAGEFQVASLGEIEPRLEKAVRKTEQRVDQWTELVDSAQQRLGNGETRILQLEQRLEQMEEWVREKEREDEQETEFATPDGAVPEAWRELSEKCRLDGAGNAQTTLNLLVRIDRYMSEFPVHHPVEMEQEDPLLCMTSNRARPSEPLRVAYRDRELTILKGRDQWLGYRIDRSWASRPERGNCSTACCSLDLAGNWSCQYGWEGGRWECEYDEEGWRNYSRRWHRRCEYLEGTHDFYEMPYLMRKMAERQVPIPETLYCVVDLVWENRIHCLSHSQYPVLQIRLPEESDPANPVSRPMLQRFTVLAVRNWDVLFKDEWTSTWVITGVDTATFPGQHAGLELELLQEPECCSPDHPEWVLDIERALRCIPPERQGEVLPGLVERTGFRSLLDFETERLGVIGTPEWKVKLDAVRAEPCP